jgi:hypothetical protein
VNTANITEVNGKKLTKPQINLLNKLVGLGMQIPNEKQIRRNPYSGKEVLCEPLAVALVDFTLQTYNNGRPTYGVPFWDRTKYFLLALWPEVYYDLID